MDAAKAQVLLDLGLLTLGAAALGVLVFTLLRRREPEIGWHHHGNVWSTPFDRLDLATAGVLFVYFFLNIFGTTLVPASAVTGDEAPAAASQSPLFIAVLGMLFFLALGAGVFCYATVLRRRNPIELFGLDRLRIPQLLLWTVGGLAVAYVAVIGASALWLLVFQPHWGTEPDLQEVVKLLLENKDPVLRGVLVVSAIVIAPLVEELIFRGFLYPVLKRYTDRFFAAIVTALLFATVHGTLPGLMPLFALALILTLSYELSGCLWVPIAIHAAFNGSQSIFMLIFGVDAG